MKLLHAGIVEDKPWAKERRLTYLMNAHRLDLETSGVILAGQIQAVLVQLANLFGSEKPARKYVALVQGGPQPMNFSPRQNSRRIRLIRHHPRGSQKRQESHDAFSGARAFRWVDLVECRPLTGRTHQIRVHLRALRLPIVADALYGGKPLWLSRLKATIALSPTKPNAL